ncbi:UDP-N-acetylmuramate dehydrogenase [Cupriavidus taiwanensis]|uniref:UDP-N-acetylenolpyruvoylglucosamine reductase n=1 Tax=Cupriavidus taiwanensis TaxID=164546 RepID=A0A7Z7JD43_9BURK|nr:UDP-N-acetylmuramate dehydrogenase [Cupriavidus taiwanensis]SOY89027.1 UDP-N-acetylenolpyruvoylglucosamine reductase, FAD-binding [Cupriavidus taiwanensis]SOZ03118.1 UDP-N-acetylenolpyruvoylglucosamine reductase, FAD-binding [Cupriavidus taiwanensis]SOZ06392.1 UDP-N-acetylenolpyruvoylglucosamine reductase, FAD-binding [Cupriavidus taiwanensis]SPC18924.1 UDP-N-acetylenolpyruvoylglucosamine reductase, FAD-binding [Cupriavidus taiwanensis]SPD41390.1 UDP-N-acetylenolpyruvoylglucosamine reductas
MADFHEFYPLRRHNTFGFDARARFAVHVRSEADLSAALADRRAEGLPLVVLGGGSNVVLTGDLDALVLLMEIPGYQVEATSEGGDAWLVTVGAGENWNALVNRTIADGRPGLENLALIPGTAGAAPIQNIGAYGVELRERFAGVRAYDRQAGAFVWLDLQDCDFGYRDSLFKRAGAGRYIITAVTLRLPKGWQPVLSYGELARELDGQAAPDAAAIRDAVVAIRSRKLPDPAQLGNAGSFFKNPLVSATQRNALLQAHPDLVSYAQPDGSYKLAAGWLIDRCGFKGVSDGPVGVYGKQALVLVHHGGGTGAMLLALANRIADTVQARYGVRIEPEPVVL